MNLINANCVCEGYTGIHIAIPAAYLLTGGDLFKVREERGTNGSDRHPRSAGK